MNQLAQKIAHYCVVFDFISADDFEWCAYGIEKRITAFITGFTLTLIGIVLFGIKRTFSFVFPFHFLRKRSSGYHAPTYISCFFSSILLEIFCISISSIIHPCFCFLILIFSDATIWLFSPCNNIYIHLTNDESSILQGMSRIRLTLVNILCVIFFFLSIELFCNIVVAIFADACLLIIPKIKKGCST